jgi:superfamily I DNA/RNA helicase
MSEPETINYEEERKKDTDVILNSQHKKKVIMAGPGTGKSHLLTQAIKLKKAQGKSKFHAITFIGKLGDALADDLAGLAETTTLHSFAREFVLSNRPKGWVYFPEIKGVILKDLNLVGKDGIGIGHPEYEERSKFYKAVGDDDVVYYALKICKENETIIPSFDLLLIDEFQDFNETEDEFISMLASKNEVIIVGDDDQALYKWKGSDPKYIRDKHSDPDYESHTLRWCSRCPEVIINAFHNIVKTYEDKLEGRKEKEYFCYYPAKESDNKLNPKVYLVHSQYQSIAQNIKAELEKVLKTQQFKSVLIIGKGKSCGRSMLPSIARVLRDIGFQNVDYRFDDDKAMNLRQRQVEAYKLLINKKNYTLAWRLIAEEADELTDAQLKKSIIDNFSDSAAFVLSLPDDFRIKHTAYANTLVKLVKGPPYARSAIAESSIEKLISAIVKQKKDDRELLTRQLIMENNHLKAPLKNLDITVCSIMGSKGLGADIVFLVGFDEGKLPSRVQPSDEEIYQMLVAVTRTKKRIYLVNTIGTKCSSFIQSIGIKNVETIKIDLFDR